MDDGWRNIILGTPETVVRRPDKDRVARATFRYLGRVRGRDYEKRKKNLQELYEYAGFDYDIVYIYYYTCILLLCYYDCSVLAGSNGIPKVTIHH